MKKAKEIFTQSAFRIAFFALVMLVIYSLVLFQFWRVQIMRGEEHRAKVSKQYARNIRIPSVRGRIFSSDGILLAGNRPSYDIVLHLSEMRQPGRSGKTMDYILSEIARIASAIGRRSNCTKSDIQEHVNIHPGIPMTVFSDLNGREVGRAAEISPYPQGMEIVMEPVRDYPCGSLGAHILGYVAPDDPQSAEDRAEFFYYLPDTEGKSGIEDSLDKELRGIPGNKLVIVNHKGFVHEVVGTPTPAQNGQDVILTMDSKAQMLAEKALEGKHGAFVLLDARTGSVLAMASSPTFNPASFIPKISAAEWRGLNSSPGRPLLNRASQGSYTPGSIFKPIVAISLLEHGLSPSLTVDCNGSTSIGNARIRCWSWRSGGHGVVNIEKAIEVSCNDFFIENGMRLGMENIVGTMRSAGLGSKTGLSIPESPGLLPSKEAKKARYGQSWNAFDTALLSIGQGFLQVTPLQAALYAAAIANGGTIWRPLLVKHTMDSEGNITYSELPTVRGRLDASQATLDIIKRGMSAAVDSDEGSARTARCEKIDISGKTGTAEVGPRDARYTNVWFLGFGETKDGRLLSFVVFVEKGASGGRTCAPIAQKFFEDWLP